MALWTDFVVEASAGLMGVFAGVLLALWAERRRQRSVEARAAEGARSQLLDLRRLLLSSVVRNVSSAQRVRGAAADDPYLFGVAFDLAVWEATRGQVFELATLDERVLFSRFFEEVKRLAHLVDFHRSVRADVEVRGEMDEGDRRLLADLGGRLRAVAEDVRLEGHVLVSDHGEPVHRRMLGIQPPKEAEAPAPNP